MSDQTAKKPKHPLTKAIVAGGGGVVGGSAASAVLSSTTGVPVSAAPLAFLVIAGIGLIVAAVTVLEEYLN